MLHTSDFTFSSAGQTGTVQTVPDGTVWSAQITAEATGLVSAAAVLEATNTPGSAASWRTLATFSVSGTNAVADSAAFSAAWKHYRWRSTGISGTGATVTCAVCVGA